VNPGGNKCRQPTTKSSGRARFRGPETKRECEQVMVDQKAVVERVFEVAERSLVWVDEKRAIDHEINRR